MSIVRLLGGLVAVTTALTAAAPAAAQDWLADRERAEGPGIRLGNFELHPGIGVEVGYDSNVFYSDGGAASSPIVGSALLRVTPHLLFSTIGEQREAEGEAREGAVESPPTIQFRGGLSASYYAYFVDEARNNLSFDGDLNLVILPDRPFTVTLHEHFSRVVRPFTEQRSGATGDSRLDFGRNENDLGVDFSFGTPGRILAGHVGYSLLFNFFDGEEFQFANSLNHKIMGGASFRFLPQTAFVYDLEVQYKTYSGGATASTLLTDGVGMRTRVGLNGAFTNRLSTSLMVGYAAGFYGSTVDNYDSIVAQAELRWLASANVKFALGYDRNFHASYVGNFMRVDRGYLNFQLLLGGSFLIGAEASIGYVAFGTPLAPDGTALGNPSERTDIRVVTSIFGEYRLTNWLGLNATVRYTGDFTDYQYSILDMGSVVLDPAGYSKVEAFLGVRAFY